VQKILLYVQSLLCVALAALPGVLLFRGYRAGLAAREADPLAWIFTREKAAEGLMSLLPLLLISLIVTGVGLFFRIEDRNKGTPDVESLRELTLRRVAVPSAEMKREQSIQGKLYYGGWMVFALCMVPVLLYVTNGQHFPNGDLESMFLALIGHTLPWIAIGIGAITVAGVWREKSMYREIEAAKEQMKQEKAAGVTPPERKKTDCSSDRIRLVRIIILVLALCLIAAGIGNGGARDVFGKAVKICTECVGLG
jgi:hypothetical protein